ncbi:MAG: alpha/beta hydrolase [Leptolyngbyaceae cyanobacterium]
MEPKALPVILRKFIFRDEVSPDDRSYLDHDIDQGQDEAAVRLSKIGAPGANHSPIPGYFVMSSAPPNIEEAKEMQPSEVQDAAQGVSEIASYLYEIYTRHGESDADPELTIAVHGYNSGRSTVRDWYKNIFQYINRHDAAIPKQRNQVFIGYRWPSENIEWGRLGEACRALPPLPRDLMFAGFFGALLLLVLELTSLDKTWVGFAISLTLAILLGISMLVLTLVVLRMIVYFRDRYRAQNFGVLDLVELLRQIDRSLVNMKAAEIKRQEPDEPDPAGKAARFWQQTHRKVKLSFLGHSMGGFVVTNVVRILSDVFDSRSIGNQPPADVGSVFRLERLILTSPDIPVLTVVSSRVNFLSSSLRRFAESYLFSSEGDLALRVASATANYFTFPSSSEAMGYRLGNVSLKTSYNDPRDYGIVNLADLDQNFFPGISLEESVARSSYQVMEHLFLTYSWWFGKKEFNTLAKMARDRVEKGPAQQPISKKQPKITIADFFTYFDCTDYKDVTFSVQKTQNDAKPKGLLTRANRKKGLGWWDYFMLTLDGFLGKRDVHGGYFQGQFTQEIIYRVAFLGFTGYLKSIDPDPKLAFDPHVALSKLHMRCRDLGIQSFLSPFRYRVNIKEENIHHKKQELIQAIDQESADILNPDKTAQFLRSQGFDVVMKQ